MLTISSQQKNEPSSLSHLGNYYNSVIIGLVIGKEIQIISM